MIKINLIIVKFYKIIERLSFLNFHNMRSFLLDTVVDYRSIKGRIRPINNFR